MKNLGKELLKLILGGSDWLRSEGSQEQTNSPVQLFWMVWDFEWFGNAYEVPLVA